MNEQDKVVSELLASWGFVYATRLMGETKRDDWVCDAWRISFNNKEFYYYTGTGLRVPPKKIPYLGPDHNPRGITRWKNDNAIPVAPTAASVLYSLLSDAEAVNTCFADWADGLGYSSDSIKARSIYDACCEIGLQLRKLFTHDQRAQLQAALQDY